MLKIGYMRITSEKSGEVKGPSVYKMEPDSIEVVDIKHTVRHEYDQQHGTTSGDRHHEPLVLYKAVDLTTPTLYAMCCNAELCTEVIVKYYVQIGSQPDPVLFFHWKLKNAYIVSIRQIPAQELGSVFAEQYDLLEEIQFSYQEIEWQHYAHRAPIGLKELTQSVQADAWSPTA